MYYSTFSFHPLISPKFKIFTSFPIVYLTPQPPADLVELGGGRVLCGYIYVHEDSGISRGEDHHPVYIQRTEASDT